MPWRFGADLVLSGDSRVAAVLAKMNSFIRAKTGDSPQNPDREKGPLQLTPAKEGGDSRVANSNSEAANKARAFETAPWFAKLPKELRDAIRAKSRREPPKGYEETLRRYYESIE